MYNAVFLLFLWHLWPNVSALPKGPDYHDHYDKEFVDVPESSIVIRPIGVILQEQQLMGLDSNRMMISLFIKSHFPLQSKSPKSCSPVNNTYTGITYTEAGRQINESIEAALTLFRELVRIEKASPQKRSILSFFNLGFNLVSSAISGFNQHRISSHLAELRTEFEQFTRQQHNINEHNIKIQKMFVHLIHSMELKLSTLIKQAQCQTDSNILKISSRLISQEYLSHIKELLAPLYQGGLVGKLTPTILPLSGLRKVLTEHPTLNDTLYKELSPALLYKAAELMIVDVSTSAASLNIHYVLTLPYLTSANTFQSYTVRNVPFKLPSISYDKCVVADLPNKVVKRGNKYYALDNTICNKAAINLCYAQPVFYLPSVHCLSNVSACVFKVVSCKEEYLFDRTGVLIHHNSEIQALERGAKYMTSIKSISPPPNLVSFIPWARYALIQFREQNIHSPTFISTYFDEASPLINLNNPLKNYELSDTTTLLDNINAIPSSKVPESGAKSGYSLLFIICTTVIAGLVSAFLAIIFWHYRNFIKRLVHKPTSTESDEEASVAMTSEPAPVSSTLNHVILPTA